jgi:hypothetical protein
MVISSLILLLCYLVILASGQSCENYGTQNGSGCACPPGFGGSTCSQPSCGGDIFQGSQRAVASGGNFTAGNCACESGWIGAGCNVCQNAGACQSGYTKVTPNAGGLPSPSTSQTGQNDTLTCNTSSRVYAASQMSCQVIVSLPMALDTTDFSDLFQNPTLQNLYPFSTNLNILRTLQPGLTPIPNTTAFGTAGSGYAQLFYDGIEQFYCQAGACVQQLDNGTATWSCSSLVCTCLANATFCGGPGSKVNLTETINSLDGPLDISCDTSNTCEFKQTVLQSLFGQSGLSLSSCVFGECVSQSVIDTSSDGDNSGPIGGKQLNGGVIAGLVVVGALVGVALGLLVLGWMRQRKARWIVLGEAGVAEKNGGVSVEWTDVSYMIPGMGRGLFGTRTWSRKEGAMVENGLNNDIVVLDSICGRVMPGQIMAILGPSGEHVSFVVQS